MVLKIHIFNISIAFSDMNAVLGNVAVRVNEILPAYSQYYMESAHMHIKY